MIFSESFNPFEPLFIVCEMGIVHHPPRVVVMIT